MHKLQRCVFPKNAKYKEILGMDATFFVFLRLNTWRTKNKHYLYIKNEKYH